MITVVIGKIIHGVVVLGRSTIQEVGGEMMMGLSIYGVAVMDGSLYSRFYGIPEVALYMVVYGENIYIFSLHSKIVAQ